MGDNMTLPGACRRGGGKAAYHHGDLRTALILAARAALQTSPAQDVSLAALALQLGVSQPAPYRHFASRKALLEAVAAHGFQQLHDELARAGRDGAAGDALHRLCITYVSFGRENWGVYRLMFSRRLLAPAEPDSAVTRLADACFQLLAEHISHRVSGRRGVTSSITTWAALHGLVTLDADGLLAGPVDQKITVEEIVADLIDRLGLARTDAVAGEATPD